MANDEHVAMLKKGVDAWNAWRAENPDIRPDLGEANLSGANLGAAAQHRRLTVLSRRYLLALGGASSHRTSTR
jgi:hypothetical protein